jgi:riboflavin synthase
MFTGIITHTGTVESIKKTGDWVFTIATPAGFLRGVALGASIACNGACLTVIKKTAKSFTVQVSGETLARTTLGNWKTGTHINLERALRVGDELGGHFVSGHVDGLATLNESKKAGDSMRLTFISPQSLSRFIATKGSVTLDGVSLTVNEVKGDHFMVNLIPHTLKETTLGERKKGDFLNLEIDLIARYLARQKESE